VVPYLKSLGITHLYTSPVMKARKGSTHGYDTVDHGQFNPELGGEAGFARLSEALKAHDLGLIIDFVPNHVGVHFADNPWWLDVLEWGQASPHAVSFDIDWDQLAYRERGGVLLPILGTSYGEALEGGTIELRYDPDEGSLSAWYFEHRLPIAPERYGEMLRMIVKQADAADTVAGKRLLSLAARYTGLRRPNRKEAPGFKAELKEIAGATDIITYGLAAYRAATDRPAQTLALHQLSPLLRRQRARRPARRGPHHVRRHAPAGEAARCRRQAAGHPPRPHRRPARSRAILPAVAPAGARCARRDKAVLHGDREDPLRAREAAAFRWRPGHHRL
jgi:(1->4)-alpha-D-glucan 1-alpha-D-glucosylmutase